LRIYKQKESNSEIDSESNSKHKYGIFFQISENAQTGVKNIDLYFNKISVEWDDRVFIDIHEYLKKIYHLIPKKKSENADQKKDDETKKETFDEITNNFKSLRREKKEDDHDDEIKEEKELKNSTKSKKKSSVLGDESGNEYEYDNKIVREIKVEINKLKLYNKNKRIYQNLIEISNLNVLVQDFENFSVRKIIIMGESLEVMSLIDYPFTKTGEQLKKFKDCVKRRMLKFGNKKKIQKKVKEKPMNNMNKLFSKIKKVSRRTFLILPISLI
jgi:hypothetical protein